VKVGESGKIRIWRSMMFVPVNVDKFVDSAQRAGGRA
jgi:hypothetical protein